MGNEEAFLQTTAAAKLAGRSAETIRLWERTGILPAVRTSSGQRLFRASDVLAAVKTRARRRRHVD
jgi:DNA-binding transcriptional MerR regulator